MRCHEVRQRLIASRGRSATEAEIPEIRDHLRICAACRAFARGEQLLEHDLAAERTIEPENDLPLERMRCMVTERLGQTNQSYHRSNHRGLYRGFSFMETIQRNLTRRPRLSLTVAAMIILLAVAALVPFKVEDTVGYQVALAGVNPDLALDEGRVKQLLSAIDADDVVCQVGDCEWTCKLNIANIKDPDKMRVILEAFNEMGNIVVDSIFQLTGDGKVLMLDLSKFSEGKRDLSNGEVRRIVVNGIASLRHTSEDTTPGDFTIWVDKATGQSGVGIYQKHIPELTDPNTDIVLKVDRLADKDAKIYVQNEGGEKETLDFDDPATVDRLRELGYVTEITNENGVKSFSVRRQDDRSAVSGSVAVSTGEGSDGTSESQARSQSSSKSGLLPDEFRLDQNHPNPFNPSTEISFSVPQGGQVTLEVFNMQGQRVKTLIDDVVDAGQHTITWNGDNDAGSRVASGVYLYRLKAGDYTASRKMTLVK